MRYKLGFIQNISYDLENGNITPKYEIDAIIDGLNFKDAENVIFYYNKTLKYGVESKYALKLYYVVIDILKNAFNKKYDAQVSFKDIVAIGSRIQ